MTAVSFLRAQAERAYSELMEAVDGIEESHSWARIPQTGNDYLHTDGSVYGLTLHVATCKVMYASVAFRDTEIRWRECAQRLDTFEPSWLSALDYLKEAQQYWMKSWGDLNDDMLEQVVAHPAGEPRPLWRIIDTVTRHDSYHAGQIEMLRACVGSTTEHPPSVAEDIREHCSSLSSW